MVDDDRVRGCSASPRPLNATHTSPGHRRIPSARSRSPSRSHLSRSRATVRSHSRSDSDQERVPMSALPAEKEAPKTALALTHLSPNVKETHLRQIFGWYGNVLDVHISAAKVEKQVELAYVMYETLQEAAKAALYMTKGQIDGVRIELKTCAPPSDLPKRKFDEMSRSNSTSNSWNERQTHGRGASTWRTGDSRYRSPPRRDYQDRRQSRYDERRSPPPYRRRSRSPPRRY